MALISCRLGAKLYSLLSDGLELVVPSAVHVEVELHDTEEGGVR